MVWRIFSLKCTLKLVRLKNPGKYVKFSRFCIANDIKVNSDDNVKKFYEMFWETAWTNEKMADFLINLCKKKKIFLSISSSKKR